MTVRPCVQPGNEVPVAEVAGQAESGGSTGEDAQLRALAEEKFITLRIILHVIYDLREMCNLGSWECKLIKRR